MAICVGFWIVQQAQSVALSGDCQLRASDSGRILAKKIIEDIFEGERNEASLLLNALERVNSSSQANVTVLKRPSA